MNLDSRLTVKLLDLFLLLLLGVSIWPAFLGWSLIHQYVKIPVVKVDPVQQFSYQAPGEPPILDGQGIAVTQDGVVYALDMNQGRLIRFEPDGTGRVLVPQPGEKRLVEPQAMGLTPEGTLLVLQRANGQVDDYDVHGKLLSSRAIGSPGARTMAVDTQGNVYIGDTFGGTIRKYRKDGLPDLGWGERGIVGISMVVGLAPLPDGNLCASSAQNATVYCYDALGRLTSQQKSRGGAGMLAVGPKGAIYLSEIDANRVWVLDYGGNTIARLVGPGYEDDMVGQPRGVAVPGNGRIYAMDGQKVVAYRFENPGDER